MKIKLLVLMLVCISGYAHGAAASAAKTGEDARAKIAGAGAGARSFSSSSSASASAEAVAANETGVKNKVALKIILLSWGKPYSNSYLSDFKLSVHGQVCSESYDGDMSISDFRAKNAVELKGKCFNVEGPLGLYKSSPAVAKHDNVPPADIDQLGGVKCIKDLIPHLSSEINHLPGIYPNREYFPVLYAAFASPGSERAKSLAAKAAARAAKVAAAAASNAASSSTLSSSSSSTAVGAASSAPAKK